jgi:hypothetical protein
MFDLRYHVWSLAAVFLALVIGILVGVGLSGSGVTKEADLKAANLRLADVRAERDALREQVRELQKTQDAFTAAYPVLVKDMLRGKHIALLFIGPVDAGVLRSIEGTLEDATAPQLLRMRSIRVPIDAQALDNTLFARGTEFVPYVGYDKLDLLGRDLGTEFVVGGETPLWNTLARNLVQEGTGRAKQAADAVIVVRTVKRQQGETARFLHGLLGGLASSAAPVVGVEETDDEPSAVVDFRRNGLSTVDDIDLRTGRAALALLLTGIETGDYGVKPTADDILPRFPTG